VVIAMMYSVRVDTSSCTGTSTTSVTQQLAHGTPEWATAPVSSHVPQKPFAFMIDANHDLADCCILPSTRQQQHNIIF
jgi:hypothetical protein